ncbi:putative transcriptional regulator [Chryseobacterium sp. MDT2-18]|nr:putative transcriptional regulator [Chryseobacterium sp. MDT2-18]
MKIKEAREQYERGEYFTAEEARKEMMKWFKEQE